MVKVKLYKVANNVSENDFRKRLLKNLYCEEKGFGFDIISDNEEFIIQFIERTVSAQNFELPSGETSEIETVSYVKVKFRINFQSNYALYVINPPRSMKYPFEMIRTLFDIDCKLQPVNLDLKKSLDYFQINYEPIVKSMSLSNIRCDANSLAKTKIVSTKDLYPFYFNTYGKTSAVVDSMHMVINDIGVELSRTGRFKIPEVKLDVFMGILENLYHKNCCD